jgi:putative tryptophan/tyrosine transport system substrate-binding protein
MIDRRTFLGLAATGMIAARTSPARAQRPKATPRVGILAWGGCGGRGETVLRSALRELGYVEGKTVEIACRFSTGDYERLREPAAALLEWKPDVIVALNHPTARAAQAATRSIPIVMVASGDPVASGLAASLARPGGNATGLTYYATELTSKRLELLREAVPRLRRVAVLSNPWLAYLPFENDTKVAARDLGLEVRILPVTQPAEFDQAFATAAREGAGAVFVLPDLVFAREAKAIGDVALKHRLPTMSWGDWFVTEGGLMAYTAEYSQLQRRAAVCVDKILKGAKPADLPVEQPTKFELVINLKTAKALGLTIPPSLLARADEVIQ